MGYKLVLQTAVLGDGLLTSLLTCLDTRIVDTTIMAAITPIKL